jgi:hypothetical protein
MLQVTPDFTGTSSSSAWTELIKTHHTFHINMWRPPLTWCFRYSTWGSPNMLTICITTNWSLHVTSYSVLTRPRYYALYKLNGVNVTSTNVMCILALTVHWPPSPVGQPEHFRFLSQSETDSVAQMSDNTLSFLKIHWLIKLSLVFISF